MRTARPVIGLTLDVEGPGGYSPYPWYAMRRNYTAAIAGAGGLPIALAHDRGLAEDYLDRISALVVTGGAFDVDPALYGGLCRHPSVVLKESRTAAEIGLVRGALSRRLPVLGICGGEQLLAVVLGGTLTQHIPESVPGALTHEQPNPRHLPGHTITLVKGTALARIVAVERMTVNSSHHQAVAAPGQAVVNAHADDGVIEGIELSGARFCIGVQWHPEFLIHFGDRCLFDALVAACRL